jgi:hypothetical protein
MNIKFFLYCFLVIALLSASFCSCRKTDRLEQALTLAGENRTELEKALHHYSHEKPDKQKLKAARFLITHALGKSSLDTLSVSANQPYFDALADLRRQRGGFGHDEMYAFYDSISRYAVKPAPRYLPDLQHLSSAFLITHIDRSFETLQKYPWASQPDFDDFCNYVLPYRVVGSYWEGTVPYFRELYGGSVDSLSGFSAAEAGKYIAGDIRANFTDNHPFFAEDYPHMKPVTFRNLLYARAGECIDRSAVDISAMRSMGIPAALEMIPNWGNSHSSHFWTRIIGEPVRERYPNIQIKHTYREEEQISDTYWNKQTLTDTTGIPPQVTLQTTRTVPKIFREQYAIRDNSLAVRAKEEIPGFFRNPCLEDVTNLYVECKDVTVSLRHPETPRRYACLCCYNYNLTAWTAVDWAEVRRGKATFRNMGVNVLYMPAYCVNGQMMPAGTPFILLPSGECRLLTPGTQTADSATFYGKMPYRTNVLHFASRMLGRKFQTAVRSDLSDTVDVHVIDENPFYMQDVKLADAPEARYALYKFHDSPAEWIAELEFYGPDDTGVEVKLEGTEIGNAGGKAYIRHNAFDGNRVSYFRNNVSGENYIGMDFGKVRKITRIRYCPRNDDNGILPGELYELFCWDGDGWKSLGRQTGRDDYRLIYAQVPLNAILRLHNHTRGKEHCLFTWENNRQTWW